MTNPRREQVQRWVVRIAVGILVGVSVCFAATFAIPHHTHLPSVALGQPLIYRVEICLAITYGGLLVLTPLFHGLLRGALPIEIGQGGAKWQAVSATKENLDDVEGAIKELQHDSTELRTTIAELLATAGDKP